MNFSLRRIKPHCEVSNALKKWHIAYHGTSVGALRRTLDHSQLLPGKNSVPGSANEGHMRRLHLKEPSKWGQAWSWRRDVIGLQTRDATQLKCPFAVAGTSSIFSVSPVKTEGPNGYSEPEENSAPDREVPRVRLSPTMRYSGMEIFAPKVQ